MHTDINEGWLYLARMVGQFQQFNMWTNLLWMVFHLIFLVPHYMLLRSIYVNFTELNEKNTFCGGILKGRQQSRNVEKKNVDNWNSSNDNKIRISDNMLNVEWWENGTPTIGLKRNLTVEFINKLWKNGESLLIKSKAIKRLNVSRPQFKLTSNSLFSFA